MNDKIREKQHEIWSQQLSEWINRYEIKQHEMAKRSGVSKKSLSLWKNNKQRITYESMKNLLYGLYDYYVEAYGNYFYRIVDSRDVVWWVSLLLYQGDKNIIRLGVNKNIKDWLFRGLDAAQKPKPQFTLPSNFVPRVAIEREIEETLTCMQSFDHPCNKVVVLHGLPYSGKTTMANKIGTMRWASRYFFSGILLIDTGLKRATVTEILAEKKAWLSDDKNVGLVILDDVSDPEILADFLNNLGDRMRLLLTTSNVRKLHNTLVALADFNRVKMIAVNGLTVEEALLLVSEFMAVQGEEQDIRAVVSEYNTPLLLRHLISNTKRHSWAHIRQKLFNGQTVYQTQDAINELLQERWQNLPRAYREKIFLLVAALQKTGGSFGEIFARSVFGTDLQETRSLLSVFSDIGLIEEIDETGQVPEAVRSTLQGQRYRMTDVYRLFVQQQRKNRPKIRYILEPFYLYYLLIRFVRKFDKLTNVPIKTSFFIPIIVIVALILKRGILLSSKILGKRPATMPRILVDSSWDILTKFWYIHSRRLPAEIALAHHVATRIITGVIVGLFMVLLPFIFRSMVQSIGMMNDGLFHSIAILDVFILWASI